MVELGCGCRDCEDYYEQVEKLKAENARLKAEIKRRADEVLKANLSADKDCVKIATLLAENARLKAELEAARRLLQKLHDRTPNATMRALIQRNCDWMEEA